jgi:hypothetical protein
MALSALAFPQAALGEPKRFATASTVNLFCSD